MVRSTPEEYFFTLADVSGKGVKAGMYMAKASSIFRTLTNLKFPLEKVVFGVNNELVEAKFKGMFVTAVFGKLNIKTGELVFINAGHESILTFDQNKNYEYIKSEMPPIGIVKYFTESMVKSNTMNLKDKTFVVYTDGVTEGYLKNGEELGAEGVQKIIDGMSDVTPKTIVESIEKELNWGAEKLRDDITCMAININNTELIKKEINLNIMKVINKLLWIVLILFPITNSLATMVTQIDKKTFNEPVSADKMGTVQFNDDGTKMFTSYHNQSNTGVEAHREDDKINEYTLSVPYDISTATYAGNNERCLVVDPEHSNDNRTTATTLGFHFADNGMKIFTMQRGYEQYCKFFC